MAQHARTKVASSRDRVAANSRLTSSTAAVIFVLLAGEGVTILSVGSLLTAHVVIGTILIGPAAVKVATTTWRFARYYLGDPDYVAKGPPNIILRLLGPFVVILTALVILSGLGLVLTRSFRTQLMFVHKASFILWLAAMTIHVLGHIIETAQLAPADWLRRTRRQVNGATARQWIVVASVVVGAVLGAWIAPHASYFWR